MTLFFPGDLRHAGARRDRPEVVPGAPRAVCAGGEGGLAGRAAGDEEEALPRAGAEHTPTAGNDKTAQQMERISISQRMAAWQ